MIARKPILLLTFLLAWLGGIGNMWAQEVTQSGGNNYVRFSNTKKNSQGVDVGLSGFNIQFKYNDKWQSTTYNDNGYMTKVEVDGSRANICSGNFRFGEKYIALEKVGVSIVASIDPATPWAVNIKYIITNETDDVIEVLKIGSWADTKVGDDDAAKIERVGHNTIMMTAVNNTSAGAMYGITAGSEPFTTLWYGTYTGAEGNVFNDNGGVDGQGVYDGSSLDSGLAWSWTIENFPANGTKEITFGGLAPAVRMSGYKYGGTLSTPTVSIEGDPTVTYYYNAIDQNSGGTLWGNEMTSTTLDPGLYYMYAYVVPEGDEPYYTPTTPFRVAKGDYDMSGVSFPSGTYTYDGNPHSLSISGTLPADVSVSYENNSRTNAGSQTVTAVFTTSNSTYYNNPPSRTATLTVSRATPQVSDFTYTAPTNLVYDGSPKTATVNVHLTGGKTGMGTVTVKYYSGTTLLDSAPTDAGTYTVKIDVATGTNYYSATGITAANWTFTITKRSIMTTTITVADIAYDASAHNTIDALTVKVGENTIPNTNYTVEPSSVTEAGTYTLIITGANNLTGFTTKKLKVTKNLSTYPGDITISASDENNTTPIPTQIYDGMNPVEPTLYVYDKERLLTKNVDYTISYGANNSEGVIAGTITITGAGVYSGSLAFTFAIVNEYFKGGDIVYRATSGTTVAVVDKDPNNPTTVITTAVGVVVIPATVSHVVATPFQVTGIETGAFKNRTDITGISMPHNTTLYLSYIEDGAFEGCTALRYIDICNARDYTPTTLERDIEAAPFYGVPKQALVYLNGTAIAGENYVYKPEDESDYLCDEFKVYDDMNGSQTGFAGSDYGWPFENLHNFKAKHIINTRKLKAGQQYTICLPYDMTIPESFKVYQLVGANTSNNLIGFQEVDREIPGNKIEYLKPYVIIPTETGQLLGTMEEYVHEFKEERTDKTTLNGVNPDDRLVTMYGTMRYISGNDAIGKYIMQSGNMWKMITGGDYTDESNKACILPMRAYISPSSMGGARPYLSATFSNASGGTTTVGRLRLDEDTDHTAIYDLLGRKVQSPQRKGIYIINGRKVVK